MNHVLVGSSDYPVSIHPVVNPSTPMVDRHGRNQPARFDCEFDIRTYYL